MLSEYYKILETLEKYYPSRIEYDREKYPMNQTYKPLREICEKASSDNQQWLSLISQLNSNESTVIDETMLKVYYEPSYQGTFDVKGNDLERKIYYFKISVLANYYYIYKIIRKHDPDDTKKSYTTSVDYDLKAREDSTYLNLKAKIETVFRGYCELSCYLAFQKVDHLVIPNSPETHALNIFMYLFSDRL